MPVTATGRSYGGLSAEQRRAERRRRFLDAARGLIREIGVAPMTVDMVCEHAGISKRYFYQEFTTKDDLLEACAEDLYSRLWTSMQADLAALPRPRRVNAALRSVIQALGSSPADARLYMESPGFPRLRERQQRAVEEFSDLMTREAMPFTGKPTKSISRHLGTRALVAGTTDLIIAWLHGDIATDEQTLIATLTAASLGAADRL